METSGYAPLVLNLAGLIADESPPFTRLDPSLPAGGAERNTRWRLLINRDVIDLVQIIPAPIGQVIDTIQELLNDFLGSPQYPCRKSPSSPKTRKFWHLWVYEEKFSRLYDVRRPYLEVPGDERTLREKTGAPDPENLRGRSA